MACPIVGLGTTTVFHIRTSLTDLLHTYALEYDENNN